MATVRDWTPRDHTHVKHAVLQRYLGGWLAILGRFHGRLAYFDGFAGPGEYPDGNPGSPLIAIKLAGELIQKGRVAEAVCVFLERDKATYDNLEQVVKDQEKNYPKLKVHTVHGEFASEIQQLLGEVKALVPSFFFIDPFGFSGVPFRLVRQILTQRYSEVFFTFMYRDINRFLQRPELQERFDELFDNPQWREFQTLPGGERENAIRDLYLGQIHPIAPYSRAFRVCHEGKRQTLYYLIHATHHVKGALLMKDCVHRELGKKLAYLGPEEYFQKGSQDQSSFFDSIPALKDLLIKKFAGEALAFSDIEERLWETNFVKRDFREAVKNLENEGNALLKGEGPKGGIRDDTKITFFGIKAS